VYGKGMVGDDDGEAGMAGCGTADGAGILAGALGPAGFGCGMGSVAALGLFTSPGFGPAGISARADATARINAANAANMLNFCRAFLSTQIPFFLIQ